METTYVTLEQALKLKKLKFDGDDLVREGNAKAYGKNGSEVNWTTKLFHCWKPSLDYACKFLRERYDIHVTPHVNYNAYGIIYLCTVFYIHKDRVYNVMLKEEPLTIDFAPPQVFDTHEQAQSAGLDFCLKIISKKKINFITDKEKEKRFNQVQKQKAEYKKTLDKSLDNIKKLFKNKKKK